MAIGYLGNEDSANSVCNGGINTNEVKVHVHVLDGFDLNVKLLLELGKGVCVIKGRVCAWEV